MSERTTSATWTRGIVEALSATGLEGPALCAAASIETGVAEDASTAYPTDKISLLWQLAVERTGNPAIAFAAARNVRPAIFGVVGYTMMSSANLFDALERLIRYLRILSNSAIVTMDLHGHAIAVTLDLQGDALPIPRQRIEFDLLTLFAFCRWVSGGALWPLAVELTHDVPGDVQPYLEAFQCAPRFNARGNRVLLALADFQVPLPTHQAQLAAVHDRFAGARIDQLDRLSVTCVQRVRELIAGRLPDGEPGRTAIARELRMTERTLQRRLQGEGTSFHALVDGTRRELARRYLAQSDLSLAEVTYLLGFASQGNFTRACHRWFDTTPGQYRARAAAMLAAEVPDASV